MVTTAMSSWPAQSLAKCITYLAHADNTLGAVRKRTACKRRVGWRPSILFTGHALHEKGLQRQTGVGTLVSRPEQRALLVPVINRLSTAGFVPRTVCIGFSCSCFRRAVQDSCLRCPEGYERRLCPARTNPPVSNATGPAPPSRSAVRCPTRPARGVFGFRIRLSMLRLISGKYLRKEVIPCALFCYKLNIC